jgi:hypothetical protein
MANITSFDLVDFLIDRKFKFAGAIGGRSVTISAARRAKTDPQLAKEIAAYKVHLWQLSPKEFEALLDSERVQERAELEVRVEREERERFFNQPNAEADVAHWSKAAHWTLDEAIALSFGKAPELVNWERVRPFVSVSTFASEYQRRRDLSLRALKWEQLFDPVFPGIFLAWAERTDLAIPATLKAAVVARGVQVADWKTLFDNLTVSSDENHENWKTRYGTLSSTLDEHHEKWMALTSEKSQLIEMLKAEIGELKGSHVSATAVPPHGHGSSEKSLSVRERDSLLKLVIGMAVAGYSYDPNASRSKQTSEIAGDLERLGLSLDVDTVRRWLKEAAELLPPKETE